MAVNNLGLQIEDPNKPGGQGIAAAQGASGGPQGATTTASLFANMTPQAAPGVARIATPQSQQFAFDPKYSAINQGLLRREADLGSNRQSGIDAAERGYQQQLGDSTSARDKAMKLMSGAFAGRGTYHSGVHAGAQGELQTDFQKYLGRLEQSKNDNLTGIENDYSRGLGGIYSEREGLFGQQQKEQEAAALEQKRAQEQADRDARQAAAEQQRHQENLAAQQQAINSYRPQAPAQNYSNADYTGGWGGTVEEAGIGAGNSEPEILGYINQSRQIPTLEKLMQAPQLTSKMHTALTERLARLRAEMTQSSMMNRQPAGARPPTPTDKPGNQSGWHSWS